MCSLATYPDTELNVTCPELLYTPFTFNTFVTDPVMKCADPVSSVNVLVAAMVPPPVNPPPADIDTDVWLICSFPTYPEVELCATCPELLYTPFVFNTLTIDPDTKCTDPVSRLVVTALLPLNDVPVNPLPNVNVFVVVALTFVSPLPFPLNPTDDDIDPVVYNPLST